MNYICLAPPPRRKSSNTHVDSSGGDPDGGDPDGGDPDSGDPTGVTPTVVEGSQRRVFGFRLEESDMAALGRLDDGRHVSWDPTNVE
ncbi:hypothetical protein EYF80_049487 [Liparis tanakae]|uniref:Uncharacterized protein n=1 Tax=Liparis tanakae TaxID=230148 RepID=A0A4Z2FHG7_9TELE|nr:hypothetical protein EYF80_049487 [Liparis tanakae]